MKKHFLLLILAALLPMVANAAIVEIDGINYELVSKTQQAEVKSNPNKYKGIVVIPEKVSYEGIEYDVTSIGNSAFYECNNLTSVTIPSSVTSIGGSAFRGCSGLTSLTIPNSVTVISSYVFYGCSGLTSVTIPNSVTYIESYAFEGCSGLTSVTIPNSVTFIGSQAFWGCSGLTSLTIPNSVTSIGTGAFYDCSGLASVTIPNSVTAISNNVFTGCSGLTSVTIPNSVTSIGSQAFWGCSGLTSVTIPNSVTFIGAAAFSGCSGLTSLTIPNSVTVIDSYVFRGCSSLTSVNIPNSVTSIGGSAFRGCSGLTSVTIGNGISTIGSQAFASCKELTDVYCHAENVPSTNSDAFQNSYTEYATLHVPAASVNAYREADPWKNFKEVLSLSGETPEILKCATPSISYGGKKLTFGCETEGVEYVYTIKDADVKTGYTSEVSLSATYEISVYAMKTGYDNSDVATATLVWNTATFTETTAPTAVRELTNSHDAPLLIQSNNGVITIQGADDGQQVRVYGIDGTQAGATISKDGHAMVKTNLKAGNVAIIKIGDRSVKVVVK